MGRETQPARPLCLSKSSIYYYYSTLLCALEKLETYQVLSVVVPLYNRSILCVWTPLAQNTSRGVSIFIDAAIARALAVLRFMTCQMPGTAARYV